MANTKTWDFEGYWRTVLGDRDAATVVSEFGLNPTDRAGLDEWLGQAEAEAWRVGGNRIDGGLGTVELPEEWTGFHLRALDELCAVEAQS